MISGYVDDFGRALIPLMFQSKPNDAPIEIIVWVDTGFTGDLVLPISSIRQFGLKRVSNIDARLADESISSYDVFNGSSTWQGPCRKMEVIEGGSSVPLLGIRLLAGLRLIIDYASNKVRIEPTS